MAFEIDWQLVEDDSPENNPSLAGRLQDRKYEVSGYEHLVLCLWEDSKRVYKLTHGDYFCLNI
jgi:hypothetical protein